MAHLHNETLFPRNNKNYFCLEIGWLCGNIMVGRTYLGERKKEKILFLLKHIFRKHKDHHIIRGCRKGKKDDISLSYTSGKY